MSELKEKQLFLFISMMCEFYVLEKEKFLETPNLYSMGSHFLELLYFCISLSFFLSNFLCEISLRNSMCFSWKAIKFVSMLKTESRIIKKYINIDWYSVSQLFDYRNCFSNKL